MKIIADKVKVDPPHAICRTDVPKIISAVPSVWVNDLKIVRLSAGNPHPHVAIYNPFRHTLTIKSRGRTKERALHRIFTELAVHGLGITTGWGHKLQARDVSRIEGIVAPLVSQVLPLLSRKKDMVDR
jgi:hypothetical protein